MRRSGAPIPPKPATASKRLSTVLTTLRTGRTRLDSMLKTVAIDDIGHTEEGKKLRRELWALKSKFESLLPWLARIRNDYHRCEVDVRAERKLKELGVDPEEVLNRSH